MARHTAPKPKKHTPSSPSEPLTWPRADPEALTKFDPRTKRCTMNCGQHTDDPRPRAEMMLLCPECIDVPPGWPNPPIHFTRSPFRNGWTTFNVRDEDADEAERRLKG